MWLYWESQKGKRGVQLDNFKDVKAEDNVVFLVSKSNIEEDNIYLITKDDNMAQSIVNTIFYNMAENSEVCEIHLKVKETNNRNLL